MPEQQQPQAHWHLKKEVNISHLLTTVVVAVSGFWYLADLDKRTAANTIEITHVKQLRTEDQERMEKQLDNINSKLDKLLEQRQ